MFLGNKFVIGGLRMSLKFETGQVSFVLPQEKVCGNISVPDEQTDSIEEVWAVAEVEGPTALRELDLGDFGTEEDQEVLRTLLLKYQEVFVPITKVAIGPDFDIILRPNSNLLSLDCPRFRKSRVEKEIEKREVTKLLERGVLAPSLSEFGTNNVLVGKKPLSDGSVGGVRVTSDMRRLNSMTVGDSFPTEDVKELVAWIATKQFYSVMDVRDGHWNIRIKPSASHLAAVLTVMGLVEYVMMTMGRKNSAVRFQRLMNSVYEGLRWTGSDGDGNAVAKLVAYQDDISVGSMTISDYLADLGATLLRTLDHNLRFKLSKCKFGGQEVEILGHAVRHGKTMSSDTHIGGFRDFAEPTNVTKLLRFLGCVQFFANHIDPCADKADPLCKVLVSTAWNKRKGKKVVLTLPDWCEWWDAEQKLSFSVMKDIMSAPEFLVPPRAGMRRKLVTDASKYGLGTVLLQDEGPDGCVPLEISSRKLKGAEGTWTSSEKECMGVVFGLRKFQHLLCGEEFSVVTDHNALTWLMSLSEPKDRLARWVIEVQMLAFSVEYSPGVASRWQCQMPYPETQWNTTSSFVGDVWKLSLLLMKLTTWCLEDFRRLRS
jgi:RNase H-like domain found in reverse transcriptase/Reverse transcriptase (RNA-dependent DNA polymerase)